ncbi:hypothetical protein [Microbulbifer sp. DLAB2-AA]|uniref:hypothetical protein n=1 Tax=Microbulbifer sp. DLAB2-AA TaxID=3243394 RepID=UPI004039E713
MRSDRSIKTFLKYLSIIAIVMVGQSSSALSNFDNLSCGKIDSYVRQSLEMNDVIVVRCGALSGKNLEVKAAVFPPRKLKGSRVCYGRVEKRIYDQKKDEFFFGLLDVSGYAFESNDCGHFSMASNLIYIANLMSDQIIVKLFDGKKEIKNRVGKQGRFCGQSGMLILKKVELGDLSERNDLKYLMYFSLSNEKSSNYRCVAVLEIDEISGFMVESVEVLMD